MTDFYIDCALLTLLVTIVCYMVWRDGYNRRNWEDCTRWERRHPEGITPKMRAYLREVDEKLGLTGLNWEDVDEPT